MGPKQHCQLHGLFYASLNNLMEKSVFTVKFWAVHLLCHTLKSSTAIEKSTPMIYQVDLKTSSPSSSAGEPSLEQTRQNIYHITPQNVAVALQITPPCYLHSESILDCMLGG